MIQLITTVVVDAELMLVEGHWLPLVAAITAFACTFSRLLNSAVPLEVPVVVG